MNNGSSPKCQDRSKKVNKSNKLKDDSDKETVEHKQVPENENPKTEAKEGKGTSDKKEKKEKSIGCCKKCKAKSNKMKKEESSSDEEDEKQKQKTVSNEEKGTSDEKAEKERSILTWRHKSTKKDKSHGKNFFSQKNGFNPHYQTARSMYHPSNQWNMYARPRGMYPAFAKGPMYGQCGGGPFQPYQSMYRGAQMSPYPPMAATMYNAAYMSPYPPALFSPYVQSRPYTEANPITRYTSYRDNYSYFFL